MVRSASIVSSQQGEVHCWSAMYQPEMEISKVAYSMAFERTRYVGLQLELISYRSDWKNELYDRNNRIAVWLKVVSIEGSYYDFSYVGFRSRGTRLGDAAAAEGKEPEWFEIHVTRTRAQAGHKEQVVATWKRIADPT